LKSLFTSFFLEINRQIVFKDNFITEQKFNIISVKEEEKKGVAKADLLP